MEEGELSDDGLEYIISDDENEKVEQVARRIQALEQKNKEIELIEIFSTFAYLDFDGKENIQSKKRNDNGKIHESSVKSRRPQTTSSTRMRRISYRERPKKSKSLQLQKPKQSKQSSRREKTRRKGKRRRSKSPQICRTAIYEEESANGSSDEEILELRLEALSSKAEVKEIAETGGIENIQTLNMSKPIEGVISTPVQTHHEDEEREAELRLIALKSAFLKKCEARKKKKMMERPYSPSDDPSVLGLEEVLTVDLVDNMEISPSLSPYLPDMEISNDDDEVCEMDLCQSSPEKVDEPEDTRPITPIHEPLLNKLKNRDMETDEEDALRSLLLAQVKPQSEKRDDLPYIEKNLKLAVLRLKQKQNKVHVGNDDESKAGIGELFADQRNVSDIVPFIPPLPTINTIFVPDPPKPSIETTITSSKTVTALQHSGKKCVPPSLSMVEESVLLKSIAERIISDPCSEKSPKLQKIISSPQKPINKSSKATSANVSLRANKNTLASVQPVKSKFRIVMPPSTLKSINHSEKERALISSSMTDTKNIPLLSKQKLKKQSKLITSLDDCNRIVERLVINLNESDESSDEASKIGRNKMGEKTDIPPVPKNFQNNLDVFLKNIRQTGSAASTPSVISSAVTKDSTHVEVTAVKAATSAVKHLPKSAQIEYEYLINKMNKLEKEKQNHQKFLKTKQTAILKTVPLSLILTVPVSTNNSSSAIAFAPLKKLPVPGLNLQKRKSITPMSALNAKRPKESSPTKDKVHATKDSLTKCLDKISSLSQDGRNRVMEKSELNYRNHSEKLLSSAIKCVRLLDATETTQIHKNNLQADIAKLEQQLEIRKAEMLEVDKKLRLAIPRIIVSQKEIHSVKAQQMKFGNICEQVGQTIIGNTYKIPNCGQNVNKYLKIAVEKSSKIVTDSNCIIQNKNLKFVIEKTTKLITDSPVQVEKQQAPIANHQEKCEFAVRGKQEDIEDDFEVSAAILKKIHYESPLNFRSDCTIDPSLIWNESECLDI